MNRGVKFYFIDENGTHTINCQDMTSLSLLLYLVNVYVGFIRGACTKYGSGCDPLTKMV